MRPLRQSPRRRYRRDRIAHQAALTLTAVMILTAVGGIWWLVNPHRGAGAAERVDALAMLRPVEQVAAIPMSTPVRRQAQSVVTDVRAVPSGAAGATFNGRPIRPVKTIRMLVTAYSPDARSCGKFADNITASGYSVWTNAMKLVAADPRILKYGSIISVPGYDEGNPVPVLDCGGAIKGHRLDVLFPTHEVARRWGKKWLDVVIWQYAD